MSTQASPIDTRERTKREASRFSAPRDAGRLNCHRMTASDNRDYVGWLVGSLVVGLLAVPTLRSRPDNLISFSFASLG